MSKYYMIFTNEIDYNCEERVFIKDAWDNLEFIKIKLGGEVKYKAVLED